MFFKMYAIAKLTMISGEKIHVWKPGNINIWVWKEEKHWKEKNHKLYLIKNIMYIIKTNEELNLLYIIYLIYYIYIWLFLHVTLCRFIQLAFNLKKRRTF